MKNKNLNKILAIFLVFAIVVTIIFGFLFFRSRSYKGQADKNNLNSQTQEQKIDTSQMLQSFHEETVDPETLVEESEVDPGPRISAWIPYWDFHSALSSYKINPKAFYSLSPTWYYVNSGGSLGLKNTARNSELIKLCKENNTLLIPSISNSNADTLSKLLNNEELLNRHINDLVNEVNSQNFDGIDIDYEHILAKDRHAFTNFIEVLSQQLHKNGKVLTIAILWKNDLAPIAEHLSQSRAAQDWRNLSNHVDEFRIMAYDYTGSAGFEGPIAPRDWIRSILDYALENIQYHNKIVLALPLYAYEWTENTKGAKALVWKDVQNIRENFSVVSDETVEEKIERRMVYKINGTKKVIWYQNRSVTERRMELAKTYGIKNFVFWRLGGEDSTIFNNK